MLYLIGAAGCQSPRDLVRGYRDGFHGWNAESCAILSDRLVKCITEAQPRAVEAAPVLKHEKMSVTVPRRKVTAEQVAAAEKELASARAANCVCRRRSHQMASCAARSMSRGSRSARIR
jgi:hypothetical protein